MLLLLIITCFIPVSIIFLVFFFYSHIELFQCHNSKVQKKLVDSFFQSSYMHISIGTAITTLLKQFQKKSSVRDSQYHQILIQLSNLNIMNRVEFGEDTLQPQFQKIKINFQPKIQNFFFEKFSKKRQFF